METARILHRNDASATAPSSSRDGFSLIEVTLALTILLIMLLGILASLSNASIAERETAEVLESQLLVTQVLEEIQSARYETLLSFNGTFVVNGNHRADITAGLAGPDLTRIEVDVSSPVFPNIASSAVLLIADTE